MPLLSTNAGAVGPFMVVLDLWWLCCCPVTIASDVLFLIIFISPQLAYHLPNVRTISCSSTLVFVMENSRTHTFCYNYPKLVRAASLSAVSIYRTQKGIADEQQFFLTSRIAGGQRYCRQFMGAYRFPDTSSIVTMRFINQTRCSRVWPRQTVISCCNIPYRLNTVLVTPHWH